MNIEVQHWIKNEGLKYIRELGIVDGQVIVDFGCGAGHYTIPAAKVVGSKGIVYAIDREKSGIDLLMKTVHSLGISNIMPIISSKPTIDLATSSVDAVLIYDVLHYLNNSEREILYQSVNTVLKERGILSVFPKHNQSNSPMGHLSELYITDIVDEIERNHFILLQKDEKRLMHDVFIEKGIIINFKKCQIPVERK